MMDDIIQLRREVAELKAMLSRLVAVGHVVEINPVTHRVRVRLEGHDQVTTDWLQVLVPRAFGDRAYWLPEKGEQVWCLFLPVGGLEHGAVIGSSYNAKDAPPAADADVWRYEFSDGAFIEYNRATHEMSLFSKGELFFRAEGEMWMDAEQIHVFERE